VGEFKARRKGFAFSVLLNDAMGLSGAPQELKECHIRC
jgi:hypothetical protein